MKNRSFWILIACACIFAVVAFALIFARPFAWRSRLYYHQRAQRDNVPIDFYGKVVEQNGTPISGAAVDLRLSSMQGDLLTDKDPVAAQTFQRIADENGCFSIRGVSGTVLQVTALSKEGYRPDPKAARAFEYSPRYDARFRHHPDSANPVLFYMWKKGATEPLIQRDRGFRVQLDNSPITIDLLTGKSQPGRVNSGDLQVSLKRPDGLLNPRPPYDWEFEIRAINGGIVETNDVFLYQAPENGYQTGYKYSLRTANVEGGYTAKRRYYVRGRDGSFFASLELEANSAADTSGEAWGAFSIHYFLNPRGSRNLEPDSSKKLNP